MGKFSRQADVNTTTEKLVRGALDIERMKGEDLLGSPELKRQFKAAKAKLRAKPRRK